MARYCLGLATTFHDPALAIGGPDGEVRYAEAAERYRQDKRAINAEPDHIFRTAELIEAYKVPRAMSARIAASPWLVTLPVRVMA
jgi:carbamoyltransferase